METENKASNIIQEQTLNAEYRTKKQLLFCIPLFILAITIPIAAYFGFAKPEPDSTDVWFQRSGSLTVLLSVWAEYNLMKVNNLLQISYSTWGGANIQIETKYKNLHMKANYIAIVLAITGTFIWGYGDLLFTKT